jgi:hypothetical protein
MITDNPLKLLKTWHGWEGVEKALKLGREEVVEHVRG